MKTTFAFLGGAAVAAALLSLTLLHLPFTLLVTVGLGLGCLAWLVVLVVLPWNLVFEARHTEGELARAKARGLEVPEARLAATRAVARRMVRWALLLHLGSAALVGGAAALWAQPIGWVFSGLFVLATLFRPAVEYYHAVRRQLRTSLEETNFPIDDVVTLKASLAAQREALDAQRQTQRALEQATQERDRVTAAQLVELRGRLDGLARTFEETLDRLTDNREIISGVKAFLRLVREPQGA